MAYTGESLTSLNGFTITDPKAPRVQAVFLRAHLRAVAAGMQPRRGVRKGDLLDKAGNITGKAYGRGAYGAAIADLTAFIESER